MKFTQKQIVILFGAVLLIVVVIAAVYFGARSTTTTVTTTLTVWGTDPKNVFDDMGAAYKAATPNVTLNYVQVDPVGYEDKLLSAFAAGTGPDLFEIGNRELPKWQSVAAPIPAALATTFNATNVANDFPTTVGQDFVSGGQVYALPLDLDTLVMYYNKNLFDSAGIVYPPKTWDDLETDIPKLRTLSSQGQVTQAAAAIGGSEASIGDAPDLIFLLMLQNGAAMTDTNHTLASFDSTAFNFYLQFSNSASPYYTWSDALGDSVQNFAEGQTAILFDYGLAKSEIKQKAPFLSFGIAPMPQPSGASISINYPKYTGLAVAKYGQVQAAWQFILYMTTNSAGEGVYANDMGELPASRAYIQANLNDPQYGVFASQALTARSWYEADDTQIDAIINTAIQNVLNGSMDSGKALGVAQAAVSTVMRDGQ